MKKILLFLLFLTFSSNIFAQYDTEHWFAPMFDRVRNTNNYQSIYMSTSEVVPFKVDIYNNNIIVGSVMVGKNSPGVYVIPSAQRSQIITSNTIDLFKSVSKGYYLKGEKQFYASLRFSSLNHGEILTSKGNASLGKEFRAVMPPVRKNDFEGNINTNFMTSVIATENGTTVTVSDFKSTTVFSQTPPGLSGNSFTFTLDRGQSYIVEGRSYQDLNMDAFIGARIVADKPISITNGNFNGQYVDTSNNSTDILMDQGVPVDKLGLEFVLMKGNGDTTSGMEKAIIVAVKDGTQIYLNGSSLPAATINTGQYYETDDNAYQLQGMDHYNMHIKTTESVYVYQVLAGDAGSSMIATGGFNYIPPLSCYLPKKIDEIGRINENRFNSNNFQQQGGQLEVPTKLNIITEKYTVVSGVPSVTTLDVKKNGTSIPLDPSYGPFPVSGTTNWVTYSIPNITGNIAIFSSAAVTAGISAGNDAVGYGGYFAGFSFIPAIIKKEGECIGNVILEITEGFNSYKWFEKNQVTGVYEQIVGETQNTFKPQHAGYYKAKVQQGSCPEVETGEFKFLSCVNYTSETYSICDTIPPTAVKFTLGTQGIKSIDVVTNPKQGQLVIDNTAKTISYIPNAGATGTDSFSYKITGDSSVPETEEVRVQINLNNIIANDDVVKGCKTNATNGSFDLTKANVTTDASVTSKIFYKNQNDADNDTGNNTIPTADLANYNAPEGFVYVRLSNATCKRTVKIQLKFNPKAELMSSTYEGCDLYYKGIAVDFDLVKGQLLKDATYFPDVNFYLSGVKLANGWSYSSDTVVQMEVISPDGCATEKFNITFKVGARLPLITINAKDVFCDPELDDSHTIHLNDYKYLFLNSADMAIQPKFYLSLAEAQEDKNALPNDEVTLTGLGNKIYHYRFENGTSCPNVGTLTLEYTKGFASTTLPTSPKIICEGSTTIIDAGDKHQKWEWFDESDLTKVFPETRFQTLGPGKYYVILTSPNGCRYKQNFEIIGSPKAILDISKLNATFCDEDFDKTINIKFSTQVTPVILQNPHPDLKVEYYKDSAYNQLIIGDDFTYKVDTRVYVKVKSAYCGDVKGFIDFKIGNKISLINTLQTVEECDDDLDGKFLIKDLLLKYKGLFTNDAFANVKFYVKKSDAQNAINSIDEFQVNNVQLLHVRVSSTTTGCPALAELTIKIKVPKKSDMLKDKTICQGDTAELDAGPGFTSYEWYKEGEPGLIGPNFHSIPGLPVGKYYVILKGAFPNDCPYKQSVEIKAAELPTIEGIEINGSTVKITAKGGKQPYQYALDGGSYQASNTFTNVSPGLHKAYVISADDCDPVEKEFSVIEIYNLITPNGDGVNDVLDMSLLKYKKNVKFQIIDRGGRLLFEGDIKNNYIWDGKQNGKVLPTSSYWYNMEWQDFDNSPPVKYTGWILLKNRNSD